MLRVGDLDKSSKFYETAFGLQNLKDSVNEAYQYSLRFMGPGAEEEVIYFFSCTGDGIGHVDEILF